MINSYKTTFSYEKYSIKLPWKKYLRKSMSLKTSIVILYVMAAFNLVAFVINLNIYLCLNDINNLIFSISNGLIGITTISVGRMYSKYG